MREIDGNNSTEDTAKDTSSSPSSSCLWRVLSKRPPSAPNEASEDVSLPSPFEQLLEADVAPVACVSPATSSTLWPSPAASPSQPLWLSSPSPARTTSRAANETKQRNTIDNTSETTPSVQPVTPSTEPRALVLSPTAQLDVLSQISELAERRAQQEATPAPAQWISRSGRGLKRHAWEPASLQQSGSESDAHATKAKKKKARGAATKKASTRPKKAVAQGADWRTPAITRDMLDWESCSEDSFLGELSRDPDNEDGQWVFEDISDSDFE